MMGTRRANGQGYTYKNKTSYRTVIKRNGKVFTASGKTIQESRRNTRNKLEQENPNALPNTKKSKLTLQEFLISWLENEHRHNISNGTYLRYESLSRIHIIPQMGTLRLNQISSFGITRFLTQMRESGLSPRSMQQARTLLSLCLKSAEDQGLIQDNPIRKVRNPVNRSAPTQPLSLEEVKTLLSTYRDTSMGARLHLALICGLRQGEVLGLCWKDVDLKEQCIKVHHQMQYIDGKPQFTPLKTIRSRRLVMLTQETCLALQKHWELLEIKKSLTPEWDDLGLVFPGNLGGFLSPKTDYKYWQKALRLCGIAPTRLHDARHTAATLMYSQGVGIETISRALGHSSSAITSRLYVHAAEEPLKEAALALSKLLNG